MNLTVQVVEVVCVPTIVYAVRVFNLVSKHFSVNRDPFSILLFAPVDVSTARVLTQFPSVYGHLKVDHETTRWKLERHTRFIIKTKELSLASV